jgi:hypothetical protein
MSNGGQIVGLFRKMKRDVEDGKKLAEADLDKLDRFLEAQSKGARSFNSRNSAGKTVLNHAEGLVNNRLLSKEQRMQAERIFKRLEYVNAKRAANYTVSKGRPPLHSEKRSMSRRKSGGALRRTRRASKKSIV